MLSLCRVPATIPVRVDIHDMDWDKEGRLWAVNTLFLLSRNDR